MMIRNRKGDNTEPCLTPLSSQDEFLSESVVYFDTAGRRKVETTYYSPCSSMDTSFVDMREHDL